MSTLYNRTKFPIGPIVVGALGGSGTRVVAEIIREVGFYIGDDLNRALDNLWFTFLFKRPKLYINASGEDNTVIYDYLEIFDKKMKGIHFKFQDYFSILKIALEISVYGPRSSQKLWLVRRIVSFLRSNKIDTTRYIGWGWKEPNSHIYLEYLAKYYHNLKYIYVIRHGLDMAYSNNQQQLYNWGSIFGISEPETSSSLPQASLNYWLKANNRAIELGKRFLGDRFFVLNFDKLCLSPEHEISCLMDFLGFQADTNRISCLAQLPKLPRSSGRYKKHDNSVFNKEDIDEVKRYGFIVE